MVLYYFYIFSLLISLIFGLIKYKSMDVNARLIFALLSFALIGEVGATMSYHFFDEKAPVYHFTAIVSLYIVCLYFISLFNVAHKRILIILTTILLPLIGVLNCIYFQDIHTLSTNTLRLRCLVVAVLCLCYFYKILINDNIVSIYLYPHFWITLFLLVIYCFTYFFWSYIGTLREPGKMIQSIHALVSIVSYGSIGLIFLNYPKMINNDVR